MSKSKRLVFFGNERLSSGFSPNGAPTLQALIDNGYDIRAVVANYDTGRSRKARKLEIEAVATARNIPVLLPKRLRDIKDQLVGFNADAGILVAYGKIIPQEIIDIFPYGILNLHPSLLPQYRGSTPIEQAILDGAPFTGVSVMKLVREMDAGPIYAQKKIKLQGTETKQELTATLLQLGSELIIDTLPKALDSSATPTAQDDSKATYTSLIDKSDGILSTKKPAEILERQIRAYAVWPKSRINLFGHDVVITESRVATSPNDGALVLACTPGWLEIIQLVAPSGKKMSGADFLRGYKK